MKTEALVWAFRVFLLLPSCIDFYIIYDVFIEDYPAFPFLTPFGGGFIESVHTDNFVRLWIFMLFSLSMSRTFQIFDIQNIPFLLYNTAIHSASLGFYMNLIIRSMRGWNPSEFLKVLNGLFFNDDFFVVARSIILFIYPFVFLLFSIFSIIKRTKRKRE